MILNSRHPIPSTSQYCAVCAQPIHGVAIQIVEDVTAVPPVFHPFCTEFPMFDVTNAVGIPFDGFVSWLEGAGFSVEAETAREDDGAILADKSRGIIVRLTIDEYFVYPLAKLSELISDFYDDARERLADLVSASGEE